MYPDFYKLDIVYHGVMYIGLLCAQSFFNIQSFYSLYFQFLTLKLFIPQAAAMSRSCSFY